MSLHTLAANTLRALAIDATNAADSGHPGAPMGMADIAVVLWTRLLRFDPRDPLWPNRDRFVLSNGHASMLLYGLLHLAGYELPIDELKRFRQLGSRTPGHPEHGLAPGVETTTGPLGQGFANAVGMAIAAKMAKGKFGAERVDPKIWTFCGDGCLMEGLTSEAASIAGHHGLDELVVIYDDNHISIDGSTSITFTEDVSARFRAYNWVVTEIDGHDPDAIEKALMAARVESSRPTLIRAKTHIGYGSPNRQDTAKAHGSPLGAEEGRLTKEKLGWTLEPFEIPPGVRALFDDAAERGQMLHTEWNESIATWKSANADLGAAWDRHTGGGVPADLYKDALAAAGNDKAATRNTSGKVLNALAKKMPGLIGGSADLQESTKTLIKSAPTYFTRESPTIPNIAFGVREHAMGAIVNGLTLFGGYVAFGATFLTFSDYMKPAIRLAALMKIRSLFVFTHDSIYLGEDGPTHQPIEHLWALRLIPNLEVWRPADGPETAMAWSWAVGEGEPCPKALIFTRQNLPPLARLADFDPKSIWRGGYVLQDAPQAAVGIVATGSEVHVAVEAAAFLAAEGVPARVISMPCLERFNAQERSYRESVLPSTMKLVSIELGRTTPWASVVGREGLMLGIDTFGESAPAEKLAHHYQMTPPQVSARIMAWYRGL